MNLPHQDLCIKIGDEALEEVASYNYLGVNLDNRLVFDKFLKENVIRLILGYTSLENEKRYNP